MKNRKIIITGGTGFIAQYLARYFGKDNHIVLLSRQTINGQNNNYSRHLAKASDGYNITYWRWDGQTVEKHWAAELEGADIVLNLAGKSVNCRYTGKARREIIESRTGATRAIGSAIRDAVNPPKLWINAASATIYRNSLHHPNDENGEISEWKKDNMPYTFPDQFRTRLKKWRALCFHGKDSSQYRQTDFDFSVQVCRHWEGEFFSFRTPFTRKLAIRAAITLGPGGVMIPYFNLLKFGLGGRQGNGRQMYSWVHAEDLARAIEWMYDHPNMEGIYNCAAPQPVNNATFMKTLRKLTGHLFGLPAPAWMLELGAAIIGTETELILKSRFVIPKKLMDAGFTFKYPVLEEALHEIINNTPRNRFHFF